MRMNKSILLLGFGLAILSSCKSTIKTITVPVGVNNSINIPAKKGVLTEDEKNTWSHKDLLTDSIPGMSIQKAYKFLSNKKGTNVIVAIADSGVDVEHEDLKDVVWVNTDEINGNNLDDDKNGYVDDIYGWNFLGTSKGDIINADQLEITRIVKIGMEKFGNKTKSEIAEKDKEAFEEYLKLKKEFELTIANSKTEIAQLKQTEERLNQIESNFAAVKKFMGKNNFTLKELKSKTPPNLTLAAQISDIVALLERGMTEVELLNYKKELSEYIIKQKTAKSYDLDFNARQSLGDNLYDINDKFYGNNNVIGNKDLEMHGTHVAGIVAASRNNNKGVNGVANNVKLLTVRIVPDGDEHDKDVALGIRYAVDNGAKIINTSFGKRFSPNKEWVYDALKYAAKNDVLIVNAAGNDGKNIDVRKTYPNDSEDLINEFTDNVITIGAISLNYNKKLPATFSNYGKKNVDIFAPGVDIYSTVPKNKYEAISGTSMAAPSVAGVAALIRSYYPQLKANQVKQILMNSGILINFDVIKPGSVSEENPEGELVPFSSLSVSGRIVNAYNALKMADRITKN